MIASDVMTEARTVYLNDAGASLYTNAALLPFVQKAYDELQQKLELSETSVIEEVSSVISVTAGTVVLNLPSDFVSPIKLEEKGVSDTFYEDMEQRSILPDVTPGSSLIYWVFREGEIKFVGATETRSVRLTYNKALTIASDNTLIPVINSKTFLAARTAQLAATYIGSNPILGDRISLDVKEAEHVLLGNNVKTKQALGVRRRPFQYKLRS